VREALANGTMDIPPLHEDLDAVVASLDRWTTFVLRCADRLIGSVRGRMEDEVWDVGRLMVAPDLRGRGLGRWLLEYAESAAPPEARRITLFTGAHSHQNLRLYKRAGYRRDAEQPEPGVVRMSKRVRER
jgi:tRNA (guanine37-N1)-methyltransferase